jgi:hypothetical protein
MQGHHKTDVVQSQPEPVSWAPEVHVEGKWSRNGLRFATEEEARRSAVGLMWRWTLVTDARATPADEPVNYRLNADNHLEEVKGIEP